MTYPRYGMVSAIDFRNRVVAGSLQILLPLEVATAAITRKPDIDDQSMTSWGFVTRDELTQLLSREENQEFRADYQVSINGLFELGDTCTLTLYYTDERFAE